MKASELREKSAEDLNKELHTLLEEQVQVCVRARQPVSWPRLTLMQK